MLGGVIIIIITSKRAAGVYSLPFALHQAGSLSLTEDRKFVSEWKSFNIPKPSSWCGALGSRDV